MTVLRHKMIEDLQLRGLAVRTQAAYVQAVSQLAAHYRKSPDQIDEEELRQYFLFLKNVKQVSRSTHTLALCGIKFFYEHTLKREWHTLDFARPAKEKAAERRKKPIEEKESFCWLQGYRQACVVAQTCPQTQIICISDSDGDIFE